MEQKPSEPHGQVGRGSASQPDGPVSAAGAKLWPSWAVRIQSGNNTAQRRTGTRNVWFVREFFCCLHDWSTRPDEPDVSDDYSDEPSNTDRRIYPGHLP